MEINNLLTELEFQTPYAKNSTTYLTHNFHSYPAKFVPQIPRIAIKNLTKENGIILDPFCGCGTTLVEAKLLNRNAVGIDLNPIATLISKAKTTKLTINQIRRISGMLENIKIDINNHYKSKNTNINYEIPLFNNRDHWFQENVLNELAIIKAHINKIQDIDLKNYLSTAFSSIIVTVSNQESDTRYASINKNIKPFRTFFELAKKLQGMNKRILEFSNLASNSDVKIYKANTKNLEFLETNSIDHIITSPPYANTYDYYLYHKFRMYWLDYDVKEVQDNEIGSRNRHSSKKEDIETYKRDMQICFKNFNRVLKPSGIFLVVIGDSIIRKKHIDALELTKELANHTGFEFIQEFSYSLNLISKTFNSSFRNKTKNEHIIVLKNIK